MCSKIANLTRFQRRLSFTAETKRRHESEDGNICRAKRFPLSTKEIALRTTRFSSGIFYVFAAWLAIANNMDVVFGADNMPLVVRLDLYPISQGGRIYLQGKNTADSPKYQCVLTFQTDE
jgi:hypothetical protein